MSRFNTSDREACRIHSMVEHFAKKQRFSDICLYDTVSRDEVAEFERLYGITLPEDYVWFITNVGNGGLWYDKYGGYRFEKLSETFICRLYDRDTGEMTDKYALAVLSIGCSYYYAIVLKGKDRGRICSTDGYSASPCYPMTVNNFRELYVKWLEEISRGYNNYGFEHRSYGTLEQHFCDYERNGSREALRDLRSKITPEAVSKKLLRRLAAAFYTEQDKEKKRSLFMILASVRYPYPLNLFREMFLPENYDDILFVLVNYYEYLRDLEHSVMEGAEIFYPMLVEIAHDRDIMSDERNLGRCLKTVIKNPLFCPADIEDILNMRQETVTEVIGHFDKSKMPECVHKYIDAANEIRRQEQSKK